MAPSGVEKLGDEVCKAVEQLTSRPHKTYGHRPPLMGVAPSKHDRRNPWLNLSRWTSLFA